jgi:hypothetical protein
MMRLGVVERAADHIRELLADAERVDVDGVSNANAWRVGDIVIVTDTRDEVVQTVFRDIDGTVRT